MTAVLEQPQQRDLALLKANRVRLARAELKRDLKAGRVRVAPLIADPPESLLTMRCVDLLIALPKFGRGKAHQRLTRAGVSTVATLGSLTERQRSALGELL